MKETFVLTLADLPAFAEKVVKTLSTAQFAEKNKAAIILLEGDLGAGKTTFTKELAAALGVEKEEVHSPTFILKKEYSTPHSRWKRIVHVDAYRFTRPEESKVLRLEQDLLDRNALVVVEWPTRMNYLKHDLEIAFEVKDEDVREITLSYEKANHEEKH